MFSKFWFKAADAILANNALENSRVCDVEEKAMREILDWNVFRVDYYELWCSWLDCGLPWLICRRECKSEQKKKQKR
jgi:hypothetical protein